MKTPIYFLVVFVYLMVITSVFAQNEPGTEPPFKNADSVYYQLSKYDLELMTFPANDPCARTGIPPIGIRLRDTARIQPFEPPTLRNPILDSVYQKRDSGDINIYWIHGLNGSIKSLRVAAMATEYGYPGIFEARKAHSVIPHSIDDQSYTEDFGIRDATFDLNNTVNGMANHIPTERDFIIAHSQGGIVAREWLRNMDEKSGLYPNYAHGLVTFGTPHAGARILNRTRPDMDNLAPHFFGEACRAMGGAELEKRVQESFLANFILSAKMKALIVEKTCDVFANTIVPFALDNYHKTTTNDYYVGAKFLTKPNIDGHPTGLSDYVLKVPVVQFYGEEEQPIMWRFFSSTMKLGVDQLSQNGNAGLRFEYDQDDQLQIKAVELIDEFQLRYILEQRQLMLTNANMNCALLLTVPFAGGALYVICKIKKDKELAKIQQRADAYNNACIWLSNANDYYLTEIVGAKSSTTKKYCSYYREVYCRGPQNPVGSGVPAHFYRIYSEVLAGASGCSNGKRNVSYSSYPYTLCEGIENVTTTYKTHYAYVPNDGVVLAESAAAHIKVDTSNPWNSHTYRVMPRTNHDQMKNSQATKAALILLYDGRMGEAFKIALR